MSAVRWLWLLLVLAPPGFAKRLPLTDKEKSWLYMVDPIITYEERREFRKRLTTHRERAQFIDLFWAKRDPDLNDGVNTFKETYLARYDYIKTHYERKDSYEPTNRKSIIYLLFGKPDRVQKRLDFTLVSSGFRNGFPQWPPEVWIYNNIGFGYKRSRLKVQFIATSVFGEYGSRTDAYSTNFVRTFKHKLIYHPELEKAPLTSVSATNFQDVVDLAPPEEDTFAELDAEPEKKKGFFSRFRRNSKDDTSEPVIAPPPKPMEVTVTSAPKIKPKAKPATKSEAAPVVKAKPEARELTVPSTTVVPDGQKPEATFDTEAGNALGVEARLSFFTSGKDEQLLLGRFGFPLRVLGFKFNNSQYHAPFILHYTLSNADGEAALSDIIRNEIALPSKTVLAKKDPYYSKEFAIILPPGRYTLQVQLEDIGQKKFSYQETQLELPQVETPTFRTTDLTLMDANVNPDSAKFRVEGTAYGLHLSRKFSRGDRLYPLIELIEPPSASIWESAVFQLEKGGRIVREMILYEEESTQTNQGTLLIHPVLKTDGLLPGSYILRFEVEDPSGEIIISEIPLEIANP